MCGIAGRVTFDGAPGDRALLDRMLATIVHRGPDDQGIFTGPNVALGQRRLAIIDLNRRGVAPLSNEDGTIWVTLNGEIYNYRELRDGLRGRGHVFRSETDTEVLVHLYEDYGRDCVRHLRGMFAFAVWDATKRQLFAARDRLGKKPLVYAGGARAFVFGSEIKAVTADPGVPIEPNYPAIDQYLTWQYVPSPATAFVGIEKLPAAHWILVEPTGEVRIERYWSPPDPVPSRASDAELQEEIVDRLRECVRARLVADVEVGAFLSGGVDSAAVVALMAQAGAGRVRTFSIGFETASHNELPAARLIANRFGTDHHEIMVRPDAAAVLPLLVHHYNEPFADSSALPTYYVSRATRRHVTVALSGDGGDENFAGYENYRQVLAWEQHSALARELGRRVAPALSTMVERLPYQSTLERASRALAMLGAPVEDRFRLQTSIFKPREKREAYTPEFLALAGTAAVASAPSSLAARDPLAWMMREDQLRYLPDCLMVKVDIASMANSLEVRAPLLDHTFIEFTSTIPTRLKIDGSGGKAIFKRALATLLPAEVLARRKTGFGLPIAEWFRGPLQPLLRDTLLDERARRRNLFQPAFIRRMIDGHASGQRDWSSRLWALLFLELWFREFID